MYLPAPRGGRDRAANKRENFMLEQSVLELQVAET
jgi:hypothetical protein